MFSQSFMGRIAHKRGKALYAVACGEHLTKLEIKERAGLSMSTVISAVDSLAREGLVTAGERRVQSGGKPHSVIDLAADKCVYGISYRAGRLFAVALDLRGETVARRTLSLSEGVSPLLAVTTVAERLREHAPPPLFLSLALRCPELGEIVRRLSEEQGAETLSLTNTEALAYRALWRGASYPLAMIGIGSRVKCAFLDEVSHRAVDLSDLTFAPVFGGEQGIGAVLSAPKVERTLFDKSYGGCLYYEKGRLMACRDLSEYSETLVRALVGVVKGVTLLGAPRETRLFGEYVTQGFFDRVRAYLGDLPLLREEAEGEDFAFGAGIAALAERVFN